MVGYPACCIAKYSSLQDMNFVWLRKEQNQCLHSSKTSLITWLLWKNMWGFKKIFDNNNSFASFQITKPTDNFFYCNKQIRDWYFSSEEFIPPLPNWKSPETEPTCHTQPFCEKNISCPLALGSGTPEKFVSCQVKSTFFQEISKRFFYALLCTGAQASCSVLYS